MADEYKVKLKFVPDTSSLKNALGNLGTVGVGGMASGATGGGLGNIGKGMGSSLKGMTGMLGGILKAVLPMAALLMVIGNGLKPLITGIGILLRPIRDILMIGLLPLLYIMRPIGIFFRTLMKPYYQKAMALMRTGAMLQKSGDIGGAMESYALGGIQLMTGFVIASATGMVAAFNMLLGVTDPVAKAIETVSGYAKDWVEAIDLASVGIINSAHAAGAINTEQYEKLVSVFLSAGSVETTSAITTYYESIEGITSLFEQLAPGFEGDVGTIATAMSKLGMSINDLGYSLIYGDIESQVEDQFGEKPKYNIWDGFKAAIAMAIPGGLALGVPGAVGAGIGGFVGDYISQMKEIEVYEDESAELRKELWAASEQSKMKLLGSKSAGVKDIIAGIDLADSAFTGSFGEGGTIPTSIGDSSTALGTLSKDFKKTENTEVNWYINIIRRYKTATSFGKVGYA